MRIRSRLAVLAGVVAGVNSAALAGPDWVEIGDAGPQLGTAQAPVGTPGAGINTIQGQLTGGLAPDYEDCYIIKIVNPALFSLTITNATFNTQLFLFNISLPGGAYGLLANDDISAGNNLSKFSNVSNDGTNVIVDLPGDYMISVTGFNRDPHSQTGAIFNQASLTEVSGPDGPGGFNEMTSWVGTGQSGSYTITLTGAGFPNLPGPGVLAVLGLAGVVGGRRKR